MSVNKKDTKCVPLGDYIETCQERNSDLAVVLSQGISNSKCFQSPKQVAENSNADKIVRKGQFAYNKATTRNGEKISIAYREGEDCTVSSAYQIFRITNENLLNPYFLWLFFCRSEFDRYARYMSQGSAHEFFEFEEMCRVQIPLPEIKVQRELVNTYNGLKALAEQNEALIKPLNEACQSYIVDCKKKYPEVELGEYIEEYDKRNSDKKIKAVKSVSVTKEFKETGAKVNKEELEGYKLVPPSHLSYVQTTKNEKCFANALNTTNETYVVTQVNKVIRSKDESVLNIGFLHLIFRGVEFDRYAIFNSWGSARETFDWSELSRVRIPLPPPEVQQAIVDIYNCAEGAKKIANDAREKMKNLSPALVQRAING
jgi:type I restriction enzyme S subunit